MANNESLDEQQEATAQKRQHGKHCVLFRNKTNADGVSLRQFPVETTVDCFCAIQENRVAGHLQHSFYRRQLRRRVSLKISFEENRSAIYSTDSNSRTTQHCSESKTKTPSI